MKTGIPLALAAAVWLLAAPDARAGGGYHFGYSGHHGFGGHHGLHLGFGHGHHGFHGHGHHYGYRHHLYAPYYGHYTPYYGYYAPYYGYGYPGRYRHRYAYAGPGYAAPPPAAVPPAGAAAQVQPVRPAPQGESFDRSYCREFTDTIVIDGEEQDIHGTACRQADGRWRIVPN